MRVPGFLPTAGYAAPTQREAFLNDQFYGGLQTTTIPSHLKSNGNIETTLRHFEVENSSDFVSSADEFVKRALTSVAASSNYQVENNFETFQNKNIAKGNNQTTIDYPYPQEDPSEYNTYRSFKDAINLNRSFHEESIQNADNSNIQIEDVDPILIINSPYPNNTQSLKLQSKGSVENMKIESTHDRVLQIRNSTEAINPYIESEKDCENISDNDYEDQAMLDLSPTGNDEAINEVNNRDAYLTSPTSSSLSDNTPKRTFSYFPRGIINPNYPGFQHLAHTLSEHFITGGTSTSDSYDSDMSEYEMELSADSYEDLSDENNEQFNFKLNKFNNNNNIHLITTQLKPNKMHPNDESTLDDDVYEESTFATSAETEMKSFGDDNCNIDINDLPNSLKTTLTFVEPTSGRVTTPTKLKDTPKIIEINKEKFPQETTPPDILLKHGENENFSKKINRPDLLHGVSPHHVSNKVKFDQNCKVQRYDVLDIPMIVNAATNATTRPAFELGSKDEISLGVTPVDIIGDFGQEVEREFGLLVSGYRKLVDGNIEANDEEEGTQDEEQSISEEKYSLLTDASLSNVNDEIDTSKYLAALNGMNQGNGFDDATEPQPNEATTTTAIATTSCDFIEDNNAVDWSCSMHHENKKSLNSMENSNEASNSCTNDDETIMEEEIKSSNGVENLKKPKYKKPSHDDRQLPPVVIEYKRSARKSPKHTEKHSKANKKPSFTNRIFHGKRGGVFKSSDQSNPNSRKREEAEINQYQQLINDKELILSNSRYAKLSSWAQYLKNSVKDRNGHSTTEIISPSALELFDAYKLGGEMDTETLQKHLKLAKEIEKKRRSDREEIRRRLAMGAEENSNIVSNEGSIQKSSIQSALNNGPYIARLNEISSDTESHSSDSETCPKLSKIRQQQQQHNLGTMNSITTTNDNQSTHPYHGRPLSVSCTNKHEQQQQHKQQREKQQLKQQQQKQQQQKEAELLPITDEDKECDFFTKQARLQIEARMALAQAKEMAHMQMEFERQNRRMSPITDIIRGSLDKIGIQMTMDKRRVSRQMLTDMNIAQLQILVNSLHTHIEDLNESLVQFLMERDDLHVGQDGMLVDIEELTRYIGTQEHFSHQHKRVNKCSRIK